MEYDETTALVVVDVQNDFADPAGSLYVAEGEQVIPVVNREVERAREVGAAVYYTQDWHPPETPHFESSGGVWPRHCVQETWGAELHPDLRVEGAVVRKGTEGEDGYSGFTVREPETGAEHDTVLESLLREHGATRVVVVGLAADVCVRATALDAVRRGFETVVLRDGTRPVERRPGDGEATFTELSAAGVHLR